MVVKIYGIWLYREVIVFQQMEINKRHGWEESQIGRRRSPLLLTELPALDGKIRKRAGSY